MKILSGAIVGLVWLAAGCSNGEAPPSANPGAGPEQKLSLSGPSNAGIDLTVASPAEPATDAEVFDESVIFSPNFAINQNDPVLADLFDSSGVSNLCFPTSFAEVLVDLYAYHQPQFDKLSLKGLSENGQSIDPNALVRQLASECHTDKVNGTSSNDAFQCVMSMLKSSGYGLGKTELVSPFGADAGIPIVARDVQLADIREALQTGFPVILEAAWFKFEPSTRSWVRSGGHYISVFGYDYDKSWGDDLLQVKVINPETQYGNSRKSALWDTVTIARVNPQAGIAYPQDRPYVLTGSGFGGQTERGFLGMMIAVQPSI